MDEVDIENVEDVNELEARLYAQIHHEASNDGSGRVGINDSKADSETTSNTDRALSRRYWADVRQCQQKQAEHPQHLFIRNPFKAPNKTQKQKQSKHVENSSNLNLPQTKEPQNNNISGAETDPKEVALSTSSHNENKSNAAKQQLPAEKANLKINPIANWMQRKKTNLNKNGSSNRKTVNAKNSSTNIKQGLFARKQEKLQKAKRIEEKKQKSRKAKNAAADIQSKVKQTEIIDLESDGESDSSDVIVIPTAPPTILTIDDSGDEDDEDNESILMDHEENALDSTDVQMSSTTPSFIKPQNISTQTLSTVDGSEKRLENLSRCTSPCSIQSSDDFIGQTDRSRLLAGAIVMADDEDLLVLTSDINSLLEAPNNSKQPHENICGEHEENRLDPNSKQIQNENLEEFATPKTTNPQSQPRDYRVDQGQYKALDVYESESDITDSVYSKGVKKSTVIRQIDTSSDDVEEIGSCSQRAKRLRKRRASSSNKGSDHNNEHFVSSSDNEEEDDDNRHLRTAIPFISKGVAVERLPSRKRNRTLSASSPILRKRKSGNVKASSDRMSDTEFIETINKLAQGQEGENNKESLEQTDESESENIPTARDIAEEILSKRNTVKKSKESATEDVALPNDVLEELDNIFETIDQFDRKDGQNDGDTVEISDSSDDGRERHFVYKSVPGEKDHIIEYRPDASKAHKNTETKTQAKNGSPIYNVIYTRGPRDISGIGWNEEMRKFYTQSWNGEHFTVAKALQQMNPDRSLWRISVEDRLNINVNKRGHIKCKNCLEYGHMLSKCKMPRKPRICSMCGISGHREPRCPNTICMRCGNKTLVFTKSCNNCAYQNRLTCPICKIRGHSLDYCPDKWRRYHSTTEGNIHPISSSVDYNRRKFCCICGGRGHIYDNCRSALRFSEYPLISSTVKSYQKSYSDVIIKAPYNGIALNLMYQPCVGFKFNLIDQTSPDKYYGRFLRAVGMDYLLNRSHRTNWMTIGTADTAAKKSQRPLKKYVANPYLKAAAANKNISEPVEKGPNQVQEITESVNADQRNIEQHLEPDIIEEVNMMNCKREEYDIETNIQLNTIDERSNAQEFGDENFKSPNKVTSTSISTSFMPKSQTDSTIILDSDSNYSFSEHFDGAAGSDKVPVSDDIPTSADCMPNEEGRNVSPSSNTCETEFLPDYIPLIDSTENQSEQHSGQENPFIGISRRFVEAVSDDDDDEMEQRPRNLSPLTELPCEAKVYLTHFHTNYLLSPAGNAFLKKRSEAYKLKARLDFTSVGYVLVIFGLPTNQDKFQRQLLLKYRELEDERNHKQLQSHLNVPKRTYVLIKFLRDSINQLMNNLGNVNNLLKHLQFVERQRTKTGFKAAEKVRKSLNMILVGQAGLQDGTMHLDKLLICLKKLITNVSEDMAPPELRSEINDHYKFIFSAYRHENYHKLVATYNKLISQNRMPQLNIDPLLLGRKVLDTSLNEEQRQKLEQVRTPVLTTNTTDNNAESVKKDMISSSGNRKNTKNTLKRKQNTDTAIASSSTAAAATTNKIKTTTSLAVTSTNVSQTITQTTGGCNSSSSVNVKTISTSNNTPTSVKLSKKPGTTPTSVKRKDSSAVTANKSKQSTSATNASGTATANVNENCKKQDNMTLPPPPPTIGNTEKPIAGTTLQGFDKWKSTYYNLINQTSLIRNKKFKDDNKIQNSKLPSPFWSRESIPYLDKCIRLVSASSKIVEKLQRVQNKSKTGQLSYNDYLAVIKLHTALGGK